MILDQTSFKPIFQRQTSDENITSIELSSFFGPDNSDERQLAELLKHTLRQNQHNQLFLSKEALIKARFLRASGGCTRI